MKELNKALGLKETATEQEAVAVIKKQLAEVEAGKKSIAKHVEQAEKAAQKQTASEGVISQLEADQKLSLQEIAKQAEKIAVQEAQVIAQAKPQNGSLDKADAIKIAGKALKNSGMDNGWCTADGCAFATEHEAKLHGAISKLEYWAISE